MSGERKAVNQYPRETCYFCGSEGPIETHHTIPRRHGGDDIPDNLVDLCPTCHEKVERLYNKRFFAQLGAGDLNYQVKTIIQAATADLDALSEDIRRLSDRMSSNYLDPDVEDAREHALYSLEQYGEETPTEAESTDRELRKYRQQVREFIGAHEERHELGTPIEKVRETFDYSERVESAIEELRQRGEVYEPATDHLRTT